MAYLDRLEPALRRDVERAIARLRQKVTLSTLVDIITRVDLFALNALTIGLPADLQRATAVLARAVQAGARQGAVTIQSSLALTNREAIRIAGTQAAKLVTNVSRETRKAIRVAVQAGFTDGLSPRLTRDGEEIPVQPANPYRLELEDLSAAIRSGGKPRLGRADAVGQARAIEMLYAAAGS